MLQSVERVLRNLETGGGGAAVQGRRAVTLAEVASTYGMLGSYDEAMTRVTGAIGILTAETARLPDDVTMQAALAKSYKVQADLLWWQRKDLATAVAAGQRSADAYTALVKAHPRHADADDWRLFAYRALVGIGDIYYDRADKLGSVCDAREACLTQAKNHFIAAFELARSAPNQEDKDFRWKNAMLVTRERLAKVAGVLGDSTGAIQTYGELLSGYEQMSAAQPNNSKWIENLVAVHWRVGRVAQSTCQFGTALAHFDKALDLARKLHRAEPDRIDWTRELAISLRLNAQAQAGTGATDTARARYRESLDIYDGLIAVQPANQQLRNDAREIRSALAELGANAPGCTIASSP
jgi:tetratricopeptide (TPR) repeat protein